MATDLQVGAPSLVSGRVISTNPATGEILREFECASAAAVQTAVSRAHAAQPAWSEMGVRKRSEILRRFQQLLLERKSEVARVISQEEGKPYVEALVTEVLVVLDAARFCIGNAYDFLRERTVPHGSLAT